ACSDAHRPPPHARDRWDRVQIRGAGAERIPATRRARPDLTASIRFITPARKKIRAATVRERGVRRIRAATVRERGVRRIRAATVRERGFAGSAPRPSGSGGARSLTVAALEMTRLTVAALAMTRLTVAALAMTRSLTVAALTIFPAGGIRAFM